MTSFVFHYTRPSFVVIKDCCVLLLLPTKDLILKSPSDPKVKLLYFNAQLVNFSLLWHPLQHFFTANFIVLIAKQVQFSKYMASKLFTGCY